MKPIQNISRVRSENPAWWSWRFWWFVLFDLSRNDAVGMGSAGRWPAVSGGPPNTSFNHIGLYQTVRRQMVRRCFRRAAENGTRAACGPNSTASFRLNRNHAVGQARRLSYVAGRATHPMWTASFRLRACLKMVASAILADVELGLPARRNCVATGKVMMKCERFDRWTVFPGGKMPPSTAGKDACRHIFRQALRFYA